MSSFRNRFIVWAMALVSLPCFGGSDGQFVKMKRASSVHEAPSAKSKALADVDAGTHLLLRKVSPQGRWLYVEDEDGHKGWVPSARTHYNFTSKETRSNTKNSTPQNALSENSVLENASSEFGKDEESEEGPNLESYQAESSQIHHYFSGVATHGLTDSWARDYSSGFQYSVMLHSLSSNYGNNQSYSYRERSLGLLVGAHKAGNWAMPLRFRMIARTPHSLVASGPDLSVLLGTHGTGVRWGVGYSLGILPRVGRGAFAMIRLGADFVSQRPFSLELNLGVKF